MVGKMVADARCSRAAALLFALFALSFETAQGIDCYRCQSTNSSQPFLCNEFLTDSYEIKPQSCDDVYGAKYCIKHVGRFEGKINSTFGIGHFMLPPKLFNTINTGQIALTLECYQCTSADEWMCENSDLVTAHLKPKSCDHVFEAQYCIKTFGRYGGGIGTKRFCSSVDLGNYCDYVRQPGDSLTYRTCVYSCNSDGCNPASTISPSRLLYGFLIIACASLGFLFSR